MHSLKIIIATFVSIAIGLASVDSQPIDNQEIIASQESTFESLKDSSRKSAEPHTIIHKNSYVVPEEKNNADYISSIVKNCRRATFPGTVTYRWVDNEGKHERILLPGGSYSEIITPVKPDFKNDGPTTTYEWEENGEKYVRTYKGIITEILNSQIKLIRRDSEDVVRTVTEKKGEEVTEAIYYPDKTFRTFTRKPKKEEQFDGITTKLEWIANGMRYTKTTYPFGQKVYITATPTLPSAPLF
ncbi:hypothetical protein BDF19DRAFT_497046 [Syncephalis fuscata]|nr:hypothetical protein BDF19DRAFT_497046 [Syncephalis fuscata]